VLAKKVRQQYHQKKLKKIMKLQQKPNGTKKYKKYLLIKKFEEDREISEE